jgi:transcriptional regulator with XRE-family HTH domain
MQEPNTIDIKISLLKMGITQAQIAREIGVSAVMVNRVVNGIGRSKRVDDYIKQLINRDSRNV